MRLAPPALVCVTSLLVLGASSCFGCDDPQPLVAEGTDATADTGTRDSGVRDTGSPSDTGWRDTGELLGRTCEQPLPAKFACPTAKPKVGQTVCTDAMLEQFSSCFGPDASSTKCSAAQKNFPECSKCVLGEWIAESRIDTAACVLALAPKDPCATAVTCNVACFVTACSLCDMVAGSGRKAPASEYDDCLENVQLAGSSTKPKGACYDLASKDAAICGARPELAVCFIKTKSDLLPFYRGACRDGGDWSRATAATDAGSDALEDGTDAATDSTTDAPTDT